jgi:hypothetical protein
MEEPAGVDEGEGGTERSGEVARYLSALEQDELHVREA